MTTKLNKQMLINKLTVKLASAEEKYKQEKSLAIAAIEDATELWESSMEAWEVTAPKEVSDSIALLRKGNLSAIEFKETLLKVACSMPARPYPDFTRASWSEQTIASLRSAIEMLNMIEGETVSLPSGSYNEITRAVSLAV